MRRGPRGDGIPAAVAWSGAGGDPERTRRACHLSIAVTGGYVGVVRVLLNEVRMRRAIDRRRDALAVRPQLPWDSSEGRMDETKWRLQQRPLRGWEMILRVRQR